MSWKERVMSRSLERHVDRTTESAESIVRAANTLVMEKRNFSFTMTELTERSGVALQTIYRLFGNKDGVVLAVIEENCWAGVKWITGQISHFDDDLDRLKLYILKSAGRETLSGLHQSALAAELFRLRDEYPLEVERARAPYVGLLVELITNAAVSRRIQPQDISHDALLISHILVTHQAMLDTINPEYIWEFCLRALNARSADIPILLG